MQFILEISDNDWMDIKAEAVNRQTAAKLIRLELGSARNFHRLDTWQHMFLKSITKVTPLEQCHVVEIDDRMTLAVLNDACFNRWKQYGGVDEYNTSVLYTDPTEVDPSWVE